MEPSSTTTLGSRSGASLADWMVMPVTVVAPTRGLTAKPEGLTGAGVRLSKLRYLVGLPSMTLATPSDPGLFDDEAKTGSPGWVTSFGAPVPRSSTSATCMQQPLAVVVSTTVHR